MEVETNWSEPTLRFYPIKAKTIDGVAKALRKRKKWGHTSCLISFPDFRPETRIVEKITLTLSCKILMPNWPAYRYQKQNIKDSWDNMWKALKKHEDGHVDLFRKATNLLCSKLRELDKKRGGEIKKIISEAKDEIQRDHDNYDDKTDSGKKNGVELKY